MDGISLHRSGKPLLVVSAIKDVYPQLRAQQKLATTRTAANSLDSHSSHRRWAKMFFLVSNEDTFVPRPVLVRLTPAILQRKLEFTSCGCFPMRWF